MRNQMVIKQRTFELNSWFTFKQFLRGQLRGFKKER